MRCPGSFLPLLILGAMLAVPAVAQQPQTGVHWQQDIETAKVLAKQTGRLVLVHFWTPECVPCVQLESNVFSQPGVAGAIESQFVPVKLDANQNSGMAQGFGITRVPTDVIVTPEGQIVGKLISPPTPSAYIAEINQVATQYVTRQGGAYDNAVAAAPQPTLINDAYANLHVNPTTPPAASTIPVGGVPHTGAESGPPSAAAGFGGATAAAAPPVVPESPGIPQTSTPTDNYLAPTSATNRYQSPFAQSQPIASSYPGGNLVSDPNLMTPNATAPPSVPVAMAMPAQPAPAVIPNQYAPTSTSPVPTPVPAPSTTFTPSAQAPPARSAVGFPSAPSETSQRTATTPFVASAPPLTGRSGAAALPATAASSHASASNPQAAAMNGAPEQLPTGFDGFCTVTMRNQWKWVEGNRQWGVNHRGRTYLFVGQKEQQQFLQNPDYYAPALSGIDAVLAIEHRQTVPGLRKHSVDYDNQIYLFATEATLEQFTANPERYAASVRQAMGIERGELVR